MFFQLIMCCGVFLVGFLVNIWRDFPEFQPIAMLGGAIWATGNVCVVPIVKTIGLSLVRAHTVALQLQDTLTTMSAMYVPLTSFLTSLC